MWKGLESKDFSLVIWSTSPGHISPTLSVAQLQATLELKDTVSLAFTVPCPGRMNKAAPSAVLEEAKKIG